MELHLIQYIMIAVFIGSLIYYAVPKVKSFLSSWEIFRMNKNSHVTDEEYEALLMGAIYSEHHKQFCNSLNTGRDKMEIIQGLGSWWGISSQQEALESLMWLKEEGHRSRFLVVYDIIKNYPQDEWKQRALALDESGDIYDSVKNLFDGVAEMKKENMLSVDEFNNLSILAWDYVRIINNSRLCYDAGYLTEEEAWSFIMPVAKELKKEYGSWEELAKGFLIGRAMWNGNDNDFGWMIYEAKKLLEDAKSPWKKVDWKQPLISAS